MFKNVTTRIRHFRRNRNATMNSSLRLLLLLCTLISTPSVFASITEELEQLRFQSENCVVPEKVPTKSLVLCRCCVRRRNQVIVLSLVVCAWTRSPHLATNSTRIESIPKTSSTQANFQNTSSGEISTA